MKLHLLIPSLLLLSFQLVAQNSNKELPLDDSTYNALEKVVLFGANPDNHSPRTVSLRAFCPPPIDIGNGPSGLTMTASIGISMTMQRARQEGWSGKRIEQEMFSYRFLFDMLNKQDPDGRQLTKNYLNDLSSLLTQIGNVKASAYKPVTFPTPKPTPSLLAQLPKYPVAHFGKLFKTYGTLGISNNQKIAAIQRCLDAGDPAVLVILAEGNFQNLRVPVWQPDPTAQLSANAVVAVGYDDKRQVIDVMGPYGVRWGNRGFAQIPYAHLLYVKQAFRLTLTPRSTPILASRNKREDSHPVALTQTGSQGNPEQSSIVHRNLQSRPILVQLSSQSSLAKESASLTGELIMRVATGKDPNRPGFFKFTTIPVHKQNDMYVPETTWSVGQSFQLVNQDAVAGTYVYVFSVDPNNKIEVHFPKTRALATYGAEIGPLEPIAPVICDEKTQIVIPTPVISLDSLGREVKRTERGLRTKYIGNDYIITLFSQRRLDDELPELISDLRNGNDLGEQLRRALGKRMVSVKLISQDDARMKFIARTQAKAPNNEGYIVPLILKLNSQ